MRIGVAIALCALVLPAAALAKGPTAATITGPGLAKPLKLGTGPNALRAGSPMEVLAMRGGFFQVAWGSQPGRTLAKSPTRNLGPEYDVAYLVPGPAGQNDLIRQKLYPHAEGGPVTYTAAGQRFFGSRRTNGGWFRATPILTRTLVAAGLPAPSAPAPSALSAGGDGNDPLPWAAAILVVAALAVTALFSARRRPRPASA